MIKVSVIIPFFQREPGILRRALMSIMQQGLSAGICVDVVVVDDGSPVTASSEAEGVELISPFRLTIITQPNAGVAPARNSGLGAIDVSTKYIAFLDSDDTWHQGHLNQGIDALEQGQDLFFCDNVRDGHHGSNFALCPSIAPFIAKSDPNTLVALTREEVSTLILRDFPTQASTTLYRRSIAPNLLFNTTLKNAGEDVLFFMQLVSNAQAICFSPRVMVNCGTGINLYFSTFSWDSPGLLPRVIDRLNAHILVPEVVQLSPKNKRWNKGYIASLKRELAFHTLRRLATSKGKWPPEIKRLASKDRWFMVWFPAYAVQVAVGRAFGIYHPK